MTLKLCLDLLEILKKACPVDTGQLKGSIQMLQLNAQEFVVIIGNADGSINGTPSNQYAAFTNNAKNITWRGKTFKNPNYHWANNAVLEWANKNILEIQIETEDVEDE